MSLTNKKRDRLKYLLKFRWLRKLFRRRKDRPLSSASPVPNPGNLTVSVGTSQINATQTMNNSQSLYHNSPPASPGSPPLPSSPESQVNPSAQSQSETEAPSIQPNTTASTAHTQPCREPELFSTQRISIIDTSPIQLHDEPENLSAQQNRITVTSSPHETTMLLIHQNPVAVASPPHPYGGPEGLSTWASSTTVDSSPQPHALVDNSVDTATTSQATPLKTESTMKENLKLTGRFLETLITKAANIMSTDPVNVVLGLLKAVIETKNVIGDNKDAVLRRIVSTGEQLETVVKELQMWESANDTRKREWVDGFTRTLIGEVTELKKLRDGSKARKFIDHEHEKSQIAAIFERVNEARVQFELAMEVRVFKSVYEMERNIQKFLLKQLKPSKIADHKYHLESEDERQLRREVCTPETRVHILDNISTWAKNTSSDSPCLYWLFGPAGSGKSTIAYTIARRFEFAGDATDTIVLGGNFFCSRLYEETRLSRCIVRTIAHHLALKCKPFADNLKAFDAVDQNVRAQLESLLLIPWRASESGRCSDPSLPPTPYLIVIDALDEIDGEGGSDFLRNLLNIINANQQRLKGFKFFITSREDPQLVELVNSFEQKRLYRLQDVTKKEVHADIVKYLTKSGPHFNDHPRVNQLASLADGLFIYAATVVKYLKHREPSEREEFLVKLLDTSKPLVSQPPSSFVPLDKLYTEILDQAFRRFDRGESDWKDRVSIFHTFLSTAERTSTSVVANLLFGSAGADVVDALLKSLHAVLYVEGDKVLWYHKSFPDFVFTKSRGKQFSCDQHTHHQLLASSCFRIMENNLRFNIADIESSYILDADNTALPDAIKNHINPVLGYSCRNWNHHLCASKLAPSLLDTLSDFLELRALFWIEAMNLLKSRGRCEPMLRTARNWVTQSPDNHPLAESLLEAGSFAVYFSGNGASASTPHLYISALATWPRSLDPCLSWKRHFSGIPDFTNSSLGDALLMNLETNSPVEAVAVSFDGNYIVSGSLDGWVRLWDALTGEKVGKVTQDHTGSITSVAFSRDSKHIVYSSNDEVVRFLDASTGDEVKELKGHTDSVRSVAFSADGKRLVSGSDDMSVRVWNTFTGDEVWVTKVHERSVTSVAFSIDGKRVVSGSRDKSVRVWDASTGDEVWVAKVHKGPVTSVAFSPDGQHVVSGSHDELVRVLDAFTGVEVMKLKGHTNWVTSVAFVPDGRHIVSGSYDMSVRVWDALTGNPVKEVKGHTDAVTSVTFSPNSKRVVSGSHDKSVRAWDILIGDGAEEAMSHASPVISVAFSPDSKHIVSGSDDKLVRVLDAWKDDEVRVLKGHTDSVTSVAFSSDGNRIVSSSDDNSVRVWDVWTSDEGRVFKGHKDSVTSVAFSQDGERIVSGSRDNWVRIWDVSTSNELWAVNVPAGIVTSVAFSRDSERVVSDSYESVGASTGDDVREFRIQRDSVTSVAFSPDGERVISGSDDKLVRVWTLVGNEVRVSVGHTDSVTSVAFSTDGKYIVSGSHDESVRVWDALTGDEVWTKNVHKDSVTSVAFSRDGNYVVSGSFDDSVRVWDALTGDVVREFKGHIGHVTSVAFSLDGKHIVSGSYDQSVRVWDALMGNQERDLRDLMLNGG